MKRKEKHEHEDCHQSGSQDDQRHSVEECQDILKRWQQSGQSSATGSQCQAGHTGSQDNSSVQDQSKSSAPATGSQGSKSEDADKSSSPSTGSQSEDTGTSSEQAGEDDVRIYPAAHLEQGKADDTHDKFGRSKYADAYQESATGHYEDSPLTSSMTVHEATACGKYDHRVKYADPKPSTDVEANRPHTPLEGAFRRGGVRDAEHTESKWQEARERQQQSYRQVEREKEQDKLYGKQPHIFIDHDRSVIGTHPHDKLDRNPAQVEHKPKPQYERFLSPDQASSGSSDGKQKGDE